MSELFNGVKEEAKEGGNKGDREKCLLGTKSACKSPGILRLKSCSALTGESMGTSVHADTGGKGNEATCLYF